MCVTERESLCVCKYLSFQCILYDLMRHAWSLWWQGVPSTLNHLSSFSSLPYICWQNKYFYCSLLWGESIIFKVSTVLGIPQLLTHFHTCFWTVFCFWIFPELLLIRLLPLRLSGNKKMLNWHVEFQAWRDYAEHVWWQYTSCSFAKSALLQSNIHRQSTIIQKIPQSHTHSLAACGGDRWQLIYATGARKCKMALYALSQLWNKQSSASVRLQRHLLSVKKQCMCQSCKRGLS